MIEPRLIDAMTSQMGRAYEACVGRCMQNIAKYFRYVPPGEEQPYKSTYWAARKLAQLGQVNEETAQIIGMLVGDADRGLTEALNRVIAEAVDYAEPSLKKAVEGGFLENRPVPELTDSMAQVFESYYAQSADRMNLVNTVMLESTQQAYMQIVTDVNARMEAEQRLKATQEILNQETATVVSGVDTYNNAVRSAVQSMVSRGLSGFVDHAGHHWRPETYVAMDIRSTMANTARQATLQRCEDYGNDLIQVSSHSGARPLCYPWQGKILSTTDNERDVEDVDGNVVHVIGLHYTSYGQAAGLFGVNCGHFPTPFIPGFSALGDAAMRQDEEQNDKTYAESQTQRALERKLRDAKLDIDIARERGDPVALDAAKARAKAVSQQIDDFCDATGRVRHRDREYTPVKATWPKTEPGRFEYTGTKYAGVFGEAKTPELKTAEEYDAEIARLEKKRLELIESGSTDYKLTDSLYARIEELEIKRRNLQSLEKLVTGNAYTIKDATITQEAFIANPTSSSRLEFDADVYTMPDGVRFAFKHGMNRKHQKMTPDLLIETYYKTPEKLREKAQKTIAVVDRYNPVDTYWKQVYHNFTHSYATGGDMITMWRYDYEHDAEYLVQTFTHEMGHGVDRANDWHSDGPEWAKAMEMDLAVSNQKSPTEYGKNSNHEDFAESIAMYIKDPAKFEKSFPNRAKIIKRMVWEEEE